MYLPQYPESTPVRNSVDVAFISSPVPDSEVWTVEMSADTALVDQLIDLSPPAVSTQHIVTF